MKFSFSLLFLFIIFKETRSQSISDIGRVTYGQVKQMNYNLPCEVTEGRALTYCVEGSHKVTYIFNNNILNGIMTLTAFVSKNAAENELEKEVSNFKSRTGLIPNYSNGSAMFMKPGIAQTVTYSVKLFSDTFYMIHYVFNSKN
jgi:hypothetical protein